MELTARSTVFNHSSPGMSTLNTIYKSPFVSGCLYTGIPSPLATTDSPGLMVFPGGLLIWIPLPSRCVTRILEKPKRASERVMFTVVRRSFPERWNESCGVCLRTKTTSPGGIPGSSSPAPARTIRCWFAMPLSISNSCRVFSLTVLAPLHFLHLRVHQLVAGKNIVEKRLTYLFHGAFRLDLHTQCTWLSKCLSGSSQPIIDLLGSPDGYAQNDKVTCECTKVHPFPSHLTHFLGLALPLAPELGGASASLIDKRDRN